VGRGGGAPVAIFVGRSTSIAVLFVAAEFHAGAAVFVEVASVAIAIAFGVAVAAAPSDVVVIAPVAATHAIFVGGAAAVEIFAGRSRRAAARADASSVEARVARAVVVGQGSQKRGRCNWHRVVCFGSKCGVPMAACVSR